MNHVSVWERTVFGAISGLFGGILGLAAGLLAAMLFQTGAGLAAVVIFSVIYFFCIGAVRGPDAGFVAGEAFMAMSAAVRSFSASNGLIYRDPGSYDQPRAWRSVGVLVAWIGLVAVITWRS